MSTTDPLPRRAPWEGAVDLARTSPELSVLRIAGVDAAKFLQGQLSNDFEALTAGAACLAGLHNPQGRVIALLATVRVSAEEFLAVLPRDLAAAVAARLGKFVLRSKVQIADVSTEFRIIGTDAVPSAGVLRIPWGTRGLTLAPAATAIAASGDALARASWELADIAEGLPQVYAATSETFVAQMLNLDLLGAIAFDKGCYTGQEVIARAHYRGKVKRRLQRWHLDAATPELRPGDSARASDGRALSVVRVSAPGNGSQAVLAVGNFAAQAANAESPGDAASTGAVLTGPWALPYQLPE
jgi:folate-binding protein YgfZ